jgi:hypothetical protein
MLFERDLALHGPSGRGVRLILTRPAPVAANHRSAAALLARFWRGRGVGFRAGPEEILHKFDEVELAKVGPLASLQPTRLPLRCRRFLALAAHTRLWSIPAAGLRWAARRFEAVNVDQDGFAT